MAKVTLNSAVVVGIGNTRYDLKQGTQEVTAEIEKALIEAGIIEAKKTVSKKQAEAE
jgi:hypothetical protein